MLQTDLERKHVRLALLTLLLACMAAAQAFSGWTDVTPPRESGVGYDPYVLQVVVHPLLPDKLFVTSNSGSYLSNDGGRSWSRGSLVPDQVLSHPARPGTLYAQLPYYSLYLHPGVFGGEFYRSDDFGVTWQFVQSPLESAQPVAAPYASDPADPTVLFATRRSHSAVSGPDATFFPSTNLSILRSADGGHTWQDMGPTSPSNALSQADGPRPGSPDRLFFSGADGVYVSYDKARTWQPFPAPAGTRWVRGQNLNANVLYAYRQTNPGPPTIPDEILRSDDGGATWRKIYWTATRVSSFAPQLAIDPSDPNRLWLTGMAEGVFLSIDGGISWQNLGLAAGYRPACSGSGCNLPDVLDTGSIACCLAFSAARFDVVYLARSGRLLKGSLAVATRPTVEYYLPSQDRYWIATNAGEADAIDHGASGVEPLRTGATFDVFNERVSDSLAGSCRFQGNAAAGIHSRFLTLQGTECEAVKRMQAWVLEGENEFFAAYPDATGACSEGFQRVLRFFNQRADVNHRYVVDETVATQMRAKGWRDEGVSMCVPVGS